MVLLELTSYCQHSQSGTGFPYGSLPGYSVGNSLVSNNLNPEMTRSFEVGFDLNLFMTGSCQT